MTILYCKIDRLIIHGDKMEIGTLEIRKSFLSEMHSWAMDMFWKEGRTSDLMKLSIVTYYNT